MTKSSPNLCVLFAGVCGSAEFYEKLGDTEANHAIDRCINRIERATAAFKGRIVKSVGDELLTVFETPDDALLAACAMQQRVEDLPPASGLKVAIRVGFHHGAAVFKGADVGGDTVDLTARMVKLAKAGQIITTAETVAMLPPSLCKSARALVFSNGDETVEGQRLFEMSWRDSSDLPMLQTIPPAEIATISWLRLLYGEQELVLNQFRPKASLGRGINCDIVIKDPRASRSHARIERRRDKFILIDQSANGTFIGINGDAEMVLRREEAELRHCGYLSFGHRSIEGGEDVVEFEVITEKR